MKTKRPFNQVMPIAEKIVDRLTPYCERIEIAGSLRRKSDMVGDIEILAIPRYHTNLFGESDSSLPTLLYNRLDALMGDSIRHVEPRKRWGAKLKSFMFTTSIGVDYQVDLFIQNQHTWGVNMMIRTGSAEFSKKMVTQCCKGGWMPDNMFVSDARLWRGDEVLMTDEESMVFGWMNMDWVCPSER